MHTRISATVVKAITLLTVGMCGLSMTACRTCEPASIEPLAADMAEFFNMNDECPDGYALLTDARIMQQMGLSSNPDFIENPSELSAMARYGGSKPILAVYGAEGEVCLLVNGIFFPERDGLKRFMESQAKKPNLRLAALEKPVADGTWLILCAVDPRRHYSEQEQAAIRSSIKRHSEGIGARILYSSLWADHL
ncbi:MAG: hypothetical protein H7A43_11400 [Verrucomicrobia bacterium]|nr:hypothetical protein [Kiritimatiellia bacterium]MCP5489240.1 hypothetical protein [Verrucomicrobiota bacterium]